MHGGSANTPAAAAYLSSPAAERTVPTVLDSMIVGRGVCVRACRWGGGCGRGGARRGAHSGRPAQLTHTSTGQHPRPTDKTPDSDCAGQRLSRRAHISLWLVARRAAPLSSLAQRCRANGATVETIVADISRHAECVDMCAWYGAAVRAAPSSAPVVCLNAGINRTPEAIDAHSSRRHEAFQQVSARSGLSFCQSETA
jgi:hypothetical protein